MHRTDFDSPPPRAGFTLLEVLIASGVLLVVAAALVAVFLVSARRSAENSGESLLSVAARNVIARLHAEEFETLTTSLPTAFFGAENGAISFTDPGDAPISGTLEFFNDEQGIPSSFGELSGDFDLNANGTIDDSPVSDYKVLPARIDLILNDPTSPRTATIHVVLGKR
jgi:prepilin-type N-terminal cleavage/methylation domain-containing protein